MDSLQIEVGLCKKEGVAFLWGLVSQCTRWTRLSPKETNLSLNYLFLADNCFFDRGQYYRGIKNVTEKNNACLYWRYTKERYIVELSSHNFCRNPGAKLDRPWCYVNGGHDRKVIEYCDIPSCCKLPVYLNHLRPVFPFYTP